MKKVILSTFGLLLITTIVAQTNQIREKSTGLPDRTSSRFQNYVGDPIQPTVLQDQKTVETVNGRSVSYIPIGLSPNANGFSSSARTFLWADPISNSVSFIYDIYDGTGTVDIGYNISVNGGGYWSSDQKVDAAGYKGLNIQGGIMNPDKSSNPEDTYLTYFAQASDGSNGSVGGYIYGSNVLTDTNDPNFTYTHLQSNMVLFRTFSDAFTITPEGTSFYVGGSYRYINQEYEFNGQLIIGKGEVVAGEIVYTESLINFLGQGENINDIKVAFAPDGQTGYICVLTESVTDPVPFTAYHPVLLKTTDGGITWSDPIHVQLGGTDGIESIKNYWSDFVIGSIEYYGPDFNRDEVYYNLGYSCDIIVDYNGNPHITGIIAIATDIGWFPGEGTMATWHLFSADEGTTWQASALYDNIFFDGTVGSNDMSNRPYAGSTYDGRYLFFSWIDTDLDGAEANTNPNIFIAGYDSEDGFYTDVNNITELSPYWFSAFYGSMSQYVFSEESDNINCEIPFIFCEFLEGMPNEGLIQYIYIDGFTIPCSPVSIEEGLDPGFVVTQSSPNPGNDAVSISVSSNLQDKIELEICNVFGQVVHYQQKFSNARVNNFNVNVCNFDPGLYVYTVRIGNNSKTMKMIVQ